MLFHKNDLRLSDRNINIYGGFNLANPFDKSLQEGIFHDGILEKPVVTPTGLVISGNRRVAAAKNIPHINQIDCEVVDIEDAEVSDLLILKHNQKREKDVVMIAWEWETLRRHYGVKKGKKHEEIVKFEENHKDDYHTKTLRRVLKSLNIYLQLNPEKTEKEGWEYLREQLVTKMFPLSPHGLLGLLEFNLSLAQKPKSKIKKRDSNTNTHRDFTIINTSNRADLSDVISDNTIDMVFSSPPYLFYRQYGDKDKNQDGQEKDPIDYVNNVVESYSEMIRGLKDSGSIFINIMDSRKDGVLLNLPPKVVDGIIKKGMQYVDTIIWVKGNPPHVKTKTTQTSMEYIYRFTKNHKEAKWNEEWIKDISDVNSLMSGIKYGNTDKNPKIKNFFSTNPLTFETDVFNNSFLKKLVEEYGYNETHPAVCRIEVPLILILLSTDEGDLVGDNYSGMSTTGLAANAVFRRYIGLEIDPDYVEMSKINYEEFIKLNPQIRKDKT
jgi:DNA modification methylase